MNCRKLYINGDWTVEPRFARSSNYVPPAVDMIMPGDILLIDRTQTFFRDDSSHLSACVNGDILIILNADYTSADAQDGYGARVMMLHTVHGLLRTRSIMLSFTKQKAKKEQ